MDLHDDLQLPAEAIDQNTQDTRRAGPTSSLEGNSSHIATPRKVYGPLEQPDADAAHQHYENTVIACGDAHELNEIAEVERGEVVDPDRRSGGRGAHVSSFPLRGSTGDCKADAVLREVVKRYETALPGRVRGYYVCGSYADGTATTRSDLDVHLVIHTRLVPEDETVARGIGHLMSLTSLIALDVRHVVLDDLGDGRHVSLSRASLLVFGCDDRASAVAPSLEQHLDLVTRGCIDAMLRIRQRVRRLDTPLEFPDPRGPYFGYDTPELATMYSKGAPSSRRAVSLACRIASALVASAAGRIACSKQESVELYRSLVGDQHSQLVSTLYTRCKVEWAYSIPEDPASRIELRELCRSLLSLERHAVDCLLSPATCGSDLANQRR